MQMTAKLLLSCLTAKSLDRDEDGLQLLQMTTSFWHVACFTLESYKGLPSIYFSWRTDWLHRNDSAKQKKKDRKWYICPDNATINLVKE